MYDICLKNKPLVSGSCLYRKVERCFFRVQKYCFFLTCANFFATFCKKSKFLISKAGFRVHFRVFMYPKSRFQVHKKAPAAGCYRLVGV